MGLTFEQRQYLKQAVHQASKDRLTRLVARHKIGLCNGCQVPKDKDDYTPGCKTCADRRRRRAGRAKDEPSVNCDRCGRSLYKRALARRKTHAGVPRCYQCIRKDCAGCGNPSDQYTKGCRTCSFRHSERTRKLRQAEQREAA